MNNDSVLFVKTQIATLVTLFPQLQARYEYEASEADHFVEITPSTVFNTNTAFNDWCAQTQEQFTELFPDELLAFIPQDEFFGVDNPLFVQRGAQYKAK